MNKLEFIKRVHSEDELFLANIFDKINLSQRTGSKIYVNEFCTPSIWKNLLEIQNELGVCISCEGIFKNSERKMLVFSN